MLWLKFLSVLVSYKFIIVEEEKLFDLKPLAVFISHKSRTIVFVALRHHMHLFFLFIRLHIYDVYQQREHSL